MRKSITNETPQCELSEARGRVLARTLAEDLRSARGGVGGEGGGGGTNTATDLGDRLDFTFRGGDGDAY